MYYSKRVKLSIIIRIKIWHIIMSKVVLFSCRYINRESYQKHPQNIISNKHLQMYYHYYEVTSFKIHAVSYVPIFYSKHFYKYWRILETKSNIAQHYIINLLINFHILPYDVKFFFQIIINSLSHRVFLFRN